MMKRKKEEGREKINSYILPMSKFQGFWEGHITDKFRATSPFQAFMSTNWH